VASGSAATRGQQHFASCLSGQGQLLGRSRLTSWASARASATSTSTACCCGWGGRRLFAATSCCTQASNSGRHIAAAAEASGAITLEASSNLRLYGSGCESSAGMRRESGDGMLSAQGQRRREGHR
jgi:hypothetical protein